MSGSRVMRLAAIALAVVVLSAGTTLTAANIVPPSNAGIASLPFLTSCPFPVAMAFDPKNLNTSAHSDPSVTLTMSVTFPSGLPAEYVNIAVSSLVLRLPGGTQTIAPQPGGGPTEIVFSASDVFDLIGTQRGDVMLEATGIMATCRFSGQATIKITGPLL